MDSLRGRRIGEGGKEDGIKQKIYEIHQMKSLVVAIFFHLKACTFANETNRGEDGGNLLRAISSLQNPFERALRSIELASSSS